VESYSLAHIPGYHLLNTELNSLRNARVLAMGASQFENNARLPGVPLELSAIVPRLWPGQAFLNEDFTLENLQQQRQQNAYEIVHLATHASFLPGNPNESYIQLWQDKLPLDLIDDLDWSDPQVQLLVLSACSTARGSEEAELGFAGLAVQSGIPSVVASLWPVSDTGTLVMMAEFYRQLQTAPTRTEALRRTQIAALRGQLRLDLPPTNGQLPVGTLVFSQLPENAENLDLSHPYYWAAFTTVGNPW
jgi:CHAT domain-containing protein